MIGSQQSHQSLGEFSQTLVHAYPLLARITMIVAAIACRDRVDNKLSISVINFVSINMMMKNMVSLISER